MSEAPRKKVARIKKAPAKEQLPPGTIGIGELQPDEANPRKHGPRNIDMIRDSLKEVGAARSIVIDEKGRVLAGNGTIIGAKKAGIKLVRIIDATGEEIIAVRRSGLTEHQKKMLGLYDNRTAELADWDAAVVDSLKSKADLSKLWSGEEYTELIRVAQAFSGGSPDISSTFDQAIIASSKKANEPAGVEVEVANVPTGEAPKFTCRHCGADLGKIKCPSCGQAQNN